jgi:DNA (cytosine-5)-methyltransferase 1
MSMVLEIPEVGPMVDATPVVSALGRLKIRIVIVDLFCGAGGFSEAATSAVAELRERYPDVEIEIVHYAINCWDVALKTHAINHPDAIRLCQRVEMVKPQQVVKEGRIDLLVAGVECIYHSRARGDKPVNDQRRSSAWSVPDWLQMPTRAIVIECVKEFRDWGPLGPDGRPDKKRKGAIYQAWKATIEAHGFVTSERVLCCADYGDPTTRERWFLYGRSDGHRLDFPEPSHASPARLEKLRQERENSSSLFPAGPLPAPWRTARNDVIDWSLEGVSAWDRDKPLVENTLRRIDAGLRKFGGPNALPFIVALRHYMGLWPQIGPLPLVPYNGAEGAVQPVMVVLRNHGDGVPIDGTPPTVCAGGGHLALADPVMYAVDHAGGNGSQTRAADSPVATTTTADRFYVAEPVAEPSVLSHRTFDKDCVDPVDDPLRTLRAESVTNQIAVPSAQPFTFGQGGPEYAGKPRSVDDAAGTVMCDSHAAVAEPYAFQYNGTSDARDLADPAGTVTTRDRFGVAEPCLLPHPRPSEGDRTVSVDRTMDTVTATSSDIYLAQPHVIQYQGPKKAGDRTRDVNEPIGTQTTENRYMVVEPTAEPSLINLKGQSEAVPVDGPAPTQTTAFHLYAAEPFALPHQQYGLLDADSVDAPMRTIRANNAADNGLVQAITEPFAVDNFGERQGQAERAKSLEEPTPTVTSHGAGVIVEGFLIDVNHGDFNPGDSERRAQSADAPMSTVTASRRGKAFVTPIVLESGPDGAYDLPEGTMLVIPITLGVTAKGRVRRGYQLVTPRGVWLIDIRVRMLQPHELARATSLDGYQFAGTKSDVVRQIGNAVPRRTGKRLCLNALEPIVRDAVCEWRGA